MSAALREGFELNHCGPINGLIGLQAIAVFTDIVSLTMKIAKSWWLGGWAAGAGRRAPEGNRGGGPSFQSYLECEGGKKLRQSRAEQRRERALI